MNRQIFHESFKVMLHKNTVVLQTWTLWAKNIYLIK